MRRFSNYVAVNEKEIRRSLKNGMLRRVALVRTDVASVPS
jgi:hypothetical protein